MSLAEDFALVGPRGARRALTGRGSLKVGPGPLDHLYADAATAPKMPPGHPAAAPSGETWTVPPHKPAPPPAVDPRGHPV